MVLCFKQNILLRLLSRDGLRDVAGYTLILKGMGSLYCIKWVTVKYLTLH